MSSLGFEYKQRIKQRFIRCCLQARGAVVVDSGKIQLTQRSGCDECHIVGSGWSLEYSYPMLRRERACVVGFNNAALISDVNFDSYFVEFAGASVLPTSEQQLALITQRLNAACLKYFKGIGLQRNDIRHMVSMFGGHCVFVPDLICECNNAGMINQVVNRLIDQDRVYLVQYLSSVLGMIGLAASRGFRKIYIHGVDFRGAYFYESERLVIPAALMPPAVAIYHQRGRGASDRHMTNPPSTGIESIIGPLAKRLGERGIVVKSACSRSPLSALIGSWD